MMPIISLHQAHFILRSALLSDWMNNPDEFGGLAANDVIERGCLQKLNERISEILHIDLESSMSEVSDPFILELDRERINEELVFEALTGRLARLMARSWYEQSLSIFQGRTAKEVLRSEGGEDIVIEQIRKLAIDLLTRPTCMPGEQAARDDFDPFS